MTAPDRLKQVYEAERRLDLARQEYRDELKFHPDFHEASTRLAILEGH